MKENKKGLIITLIILLLAVTSSFGYVFYDKFIAKEGVKENTNIINKFLVISLTEEENENILNVFDWLIITNWGDEGDNEQFDYFTNDLSRTTAVFFNNDFEKLTVDIESGSGEATCYKLTDLNDLSIKVFGQGINYDNIVTDFGDEEWNCPSGYIGMSTGFASGPRKIKELRLNEMTGLYIIEIVPDTDIYEEYNEIELNAIYKFNFKIDAGVQLKDLKFENLYNLSGEKQ